MTASDSPIITVDVDVANVVGEFTQLHGINNGPICFGGLVDLTPWHRALDLPSTRLHDPGWPHPVVVDVPSIFPDFWADPDDPASYRFDRTDDYLDSLVSLTRKVVYRFGTSIEHTKRKYDTAPPADYEQWSKICIGIIRHLNDGWADGHHFGIGHFEIWNEPDIGDRMWSGSAEQYFDLYAVAARAIKQYDPKLLVGGPVVADTDSDFSAAFADYVTANKLPLDFFDWHRYATDPEDLAAHATAVRAMLDAHGLGDVESYLTEWNWVGDWGFAGESAREMMRRNNSARGGAFVASSLIQLQDCGVDDAHFYSGDTQWFGLFDEFGLPQKNYFGLLACSKLFARPNRVRVDVGQTIDTHITAAAGDGEEGLVVVISSFEGVTAQLNLTISGQPGETAVAYRLHWVDDSNDLDCTQTITAAGPSVTINTSVPAGSVLMISTVA